MCIISKPINSVSKTRITVIPSVSNRQTVVYSCSIDSVLKNAMILAVWNPGNDVNNITLHNMEKVPNFNQKLSDLYEDPNRRVTKGVPKTPLVVHKVGKYDVSVAPTLSDIDNVEDELKTPPELHEFLRKSYTDDYSYLIAKFQAGKQQFHPLGYTHPRADHIFIPTLHWHQHTWWFWKYQDIQVGDFDHEIFVLNSGANVYSNKWQTILPLLCEKAEPPIQPDILTSFFRIVVEGKYKNTDIRLPWSDRTDVDLLPLIDGVFS